MSVKERQTQQSLDDEPWIQSSTALWSFAFIGIFPAQMFNETLLIRVRMNFVAPPRRRFSLDIQSPSARYTSNTR